MVTFHHSYFDQLPGCYLPADPDRAPTPQIVIYNTGLAQSLGLPLSLEENAATWLSGAEIPGFARPIALAYAGHQFGGFSAQLGDGRAHLLAELQSPQGYFDLQLKGSGRTPFSRGGDGKAALGPMLREYLVSEAMAALGVPTARSLAVVATGENVMRDKGPLPGAVLTRLASSHLRIGSFQFFAARRDQATLERLLSYAIARHDPDLHAKDALGFWRRVCDRQVRLIAQWMGLGFVHGVMNTDNMALSGETIDYGPCAFMEDYAPGTVFSSIDHQGRYAYANQPLILGWNLARFAETLLPLIDTDQDRAVLLANDALGDIDAAYQVAWQSVMRAKLGLGTGQDALIADWMGLMSGVDWTLAHRRLTLFAQTGDATGLRNLFGGNPDFAPWLAQWQAAHSTDLTEGMAKVNPVVIPRNWQVEAALDAATTGDLAPFHLLLGHVTNPFAPEAGREAFVLPAPDGSGHYRTFCGT